MTKRIFGNFGGVPGELTGRHKDGNCCNQCVYLYVNCSSTGADKVCGADGRFIAVNPDDEAFLLARLKGEI